MARIAFAAQLLRQRIFGPPPLCPYCGSRYYSLLRRKRVLMDVNRCDFCGVIYRWPVGSTDEITNYYNRIYPKLSREHWHWEPGELEAQMRNNFVGSKYDRSPKLELVKRFKDGGRLLDFGAGWGVMAFQAQNYGYEVLGYEVATVFAEFASQKLGIDMLTALEQVASLPVSSFDVILLHHVLEHLHNPREILDMLVPLLKRDGVLVLFVPNAGGDRGVRNATLWLGENHILALTREFFLKNLPKHGLEPYVVSSPYCFERGDPDYFRTISCRGDELMAVGRKRLHYET